MHTNSISKSGTWWEGTSQSEPSKCIHSQKELKLLHPSRRRDKLSEKPKVAIAQREASYLQQCTRGTGNSLPQSENLAISSKYIHNHGYVLHVSWMLHFVHVDFVWIDNSSAIHHWKGSFGLCSSWGSIFISMLPCREWRVNEVTQPWVIEVSEFGTFLNHTHLVEDCHHNRWFPVKNVAKTVERGIEHSASVTCESSWNSATRTFSVTDLQFTIDAQECIQRSSDIHPIMEIVDLCVQCCFRICHNRRFPRVRSNPWETRFQSALLCTNPIRVSQHDWFRECCI
jgi:hypothetical protein